MDPYAILVSEIMCQQTQVATVIPYFERWMLRFPDCASLAAATEHDALGLWQGLGYYSRARNLHKAAKAVVELHGAAFPRELAKIRALPGVGRYTAGAVSAFAFDAAVPLVDANIARVLARFFARTSPVDTPAGLRQVWARAEELQPAGRGRQFNAGLMELGALVCTPRAPQCGTCPVSDFCEAAALGIALELPAKRPRRKTVQLAERCALVVRGGEVLLEQQTGSRWRGLWKLPALPRAPAATPDLVFDYPFTHHKVTLSVYRRKRAAAPGSRWHAIAGLESVPLAAPHRRALEKLLGAAAGGN